MISAHNPTYALLAISSHDTSSWLATLTERFSSQEVALIREACDVASPLYQGHAELTGTPLLQHALGAATILIDMNMDAETIIATLLHAVPDYLADWQPTLQARFGTNITSLVEGISRMEKIQAFSETEGPRAAELSREEQAQQIESLRKMLLAMVQDIRVVLIKLA